MDTWGVVGAFALKLQSRQGWLFDKHESWPNLFRNKDSLNLSDKYQSDKLIE